MAFAGLKKQFNKANQYMSEKVGSAEGTKLDHDFTEMERKTDVTNELVEEVQQKVKEFLQPNPGARAKMAAVKGISKLSGQAKTNTYPQTEGILGDCMVTYGKKLGEESILAQSLIDTGDALKQMADVKYALDDNVKQNFLEPLHQLQTKDLKEVMHHRKKLSGRRLDFDGMRRKHAKGNSSVTDDEIRFAEDKFAESLQLAQMGMFNLLENDIEQISQLTVFAESLLDYHRQCTDILQYLTESLQQKKEEALSRPKSHFVPKTLADLNIDTLSITSAGSDTNSNFGGRFHNNSLIKSKANVYASQQNLSTHKSSISSSSSVQTFSRSKVYGSQQSLQSNGQRPSVNTNNQQPIDAWMNAWDDQNNNPAPSAPAAATYSQRSFNNNVNLYNNSNNPHRNSFKKPMSIHNHSSGHQAFSSQNRQVDLFNDDPVWSVKPQPTISAPQSQKTSVDLINNFNNNYRNNTSSFAHCVALYDFEPEQPGELKFSENDTIRLITRIDDNWFEGTVNGRTGYFPQSYVEVKIPL